MFYVARRSHPANLARARLREILRERDAILRAYPALGRSAVRAPAARREPRPKSTASNRLSSPFGLLKTN
jgi:hypothetical protein